MSAEEYRALTRGKLSYPTTGKTGPPKPPKYRNVRVYVYEDGYVSETKTDSHGVLKEKFDSRKEYRRCQELRLLERGKKISNLRLQTPLQISPAFVDGEGKKHRAVIYRADFTYTEDGREIVEDVKGYSEKQQKYLCTETFRLKWKLLQSLYPDKVFRLY